MPSYAGQVARVVEQVACADDHVVQAGWRSFPGGSRTGEQMAQPRGGVTESGGDRRTQLAHGQHRPEIRVDHDRAEAGDDEAPEARRGGGEGSPLRPGRRQVGERQREAGLQAGRAIAWQSLKGQVGDELAEEHQRQHQRELGHAAREERRRDAEAEAAQEPCQADQVGLVLPTEVPRAREERREEGDLRATRKSEPDFLSQQQEKNENELDSSVDGVEINELSSGQKRLEGDQLARQACAQGGKDRIVGRR